MYNCFAKYVLTLVCCVALMTMGCGNNSSKSSQKTYNNTSEPKTIAIQVKNPIPKDFVAINVLNKVIYVPKEYKKMEIPRQNPNGGIALMGDVWIKDEKSKDPIIDRYDVMVMYEKSSDLRRMKPREEEQVLDLIFKNFWQSMNQSAKVATKHELISREVCENVDGHKYLKFVYISGNPDKPRFDKIERVAIYIFDDTIYYITAGELVRANNKNAAEIELILNTFATNQQERRSITTKEDLSPQKLSLEKEAVNFFKKYHEAITNKEFEFAFNCLSPNLQRELGGFDKYFEGFITTVSSRVQSTEVLSVQENTVVIKYVLKAEDFGESKNADIVEQRFSGKAVLRKFDGIWKIVDNRAKRL